MSDGRPGRGQTSARPAAASSDIGGDARAALGIGAFVLVLWFSIVCFVGVGLVYICGSLQRTSFLFVRSFVRTHAQISSRDHAHLRDLSQIKFLVIDEADRLVRQGSFPQLARILEEVHRANPMENDDDDDGNEGSGMEDEDEDPNNNMTRLRGLPGLPGEAKVTMLSPELLRQMQEQNGEAAAAAAPMVQELDDSEDDDDDDDDESLSEQQEANDYDDSEDDISLPARPPVVRQTFIYSATLTLPSLQQQQQKQKSNKKKQHRNSSAVSVDGAIAEILEKARAKGKTKIVDLTNGDTSKARVRSVVADSANDNKNNTVVETTASAATSKTEKTATTTTSSAFRLPDGLQLQQIKCTQRHKDSHLYAYLMTTVDGTQGPALVFCNSVAGVRRVGGVLQTLGLSVRLLHAQMQQVCFCFMCRNDANERAVRKQLLDEPETAGVKKTLLLNRVGFCEQSLSSVDFLNQ